MIVATMDTEHFSFIAVGHGPNEARAAMMRGIMAHWDFPHEWDGGEFVDPDDVVEWYGVNLTDDLGAHGCALDGRRIT